MLYFYIPRKHKKTLRVFDVFRGYKNVTLGRNELMFEGVLNPFLSFSVFVYNEDYFINGHMHALLLQF